LSKKNSFLKKGISSTLHCNLKVIGLIFFAKTLQEKEAGLVWKKFNLCIELRSSRKRKILTLELLLMEINSQHDLEISELSNKSKMSNLKFRFSTG